MATETVTPSAVQPSIEVRRAQVILGEIANIASRTDRICFHTLSAINEDTLAQEHQLDHLRDVICQLGYLADVANDQLGGHSMMSRSARVEDWMLPPVYPSASNGA